MSEVEPQREWGLGKTYRHRIGKNYPDLLPMLGLTPREWAGRQAFARLSVADKAKLTQRGKDALKAHTNTKTPKTT